MDESPGRINKSRENDGFQHCTRRLFLNHNTLSGWAGIAKSMELPRHLLVIFVHPSGKVWVIVRIDVLADIGLGGKTRWVTADVFLSFGLIHPYVINLEVYREWYVFQVNGTKILGHAQIDDNILELVFSNGRATLFHANGTYHRFL